MSDKSASQFERYWRDEIVYEIEEQMHDGPCDCGVCAGMIKAMLIAEGKLP